MPTFTAIALENLLEPRARDSLKNSLTGNHKNPTPENGGPRHLYISPTLYTTPEQTPVPGVSSPDPYHPSPYLVNLKRRRGGYEKTTEVPESPCEDESDGFGLEGVGENSVNENNIVAGEDVEFLDPRSETVSVGSEVDANDFCRNQLESRSFVSSQGEFFDAIDEFSSDGSISSTPSFESRIESDLRASRLSLLEEIERRKTAEETLTLMQNHWERIRNMMSEAGITFPAPPSANDNLQLETDQISQEIIVARFVAESVGRGQAHAEAEEAASAIIELKDQEISRLHDKLQYYETVNHEMSQRNLVEVARRQQERKKRSRRRWLWSFVGVSVAIGASVAVYSCIPLTGEHLSFLKSGDSSNAASINCSETSQ
ncbi:hypothetical protein ACS0TY_002986 [Phlomoides rotata]